MAIEFNFDSQRHLYLVRGRPVPSVTQVLHASGLAADYSTVDAETLERKRVIGEYVHKATQYLDEGSLDYESVDPSLQGYLAAYEAFRRESGFRPQLIEQRLVARVSGMVCGGTIDRVGTMADKLWILDLNASTGSIPVSPFKPPTTNYSYRNRLFHPSATPAPCCN